jgi:hypothetical protein
MKWCNLLNMWCDDIDDDVANFCDGDCNCCDEMEEVKGEQYPCKPDIFEQTYEKVDKEYR